MSKIITFSGAKGGIGKSILSANCANILAESGYKTLLIDGDIKLANLDIILNVRCEKNILDFLQEECDIKDSIVQVKNNLFLLPTSSGDETSDCFDDQSYAKILNSVRDDFDFIIIDTSSSISEATKSFLALSDAIVVIVVPDPAAIINSYSTIKFASKFNHNQYILFNKTRDKTEALGIFENLKKVASNNIKSDLSLKYIGFIKNDKQITKSVKERLLFSDEYPYMLPVKVLKEGLSVILQDFNYNPLDTKSLNGIFGFLGRLSNSI